MTSAKNFLHGLIIKNRRPHELSIHTKVQSGLDFSQEDDKLESMTKLSFLLVASAFAISGIFAVLTKQTPTRISRQEVPERPTLRGPASPDINTSSQPAALSVRPSTEASAGLNVTEAQIHLMEQNLSDLQQDVSLFKDTHGWVVRFHHPSRVMAALGVKDNDVISFKQLQRIKSEPALESLVHRLEVILSHLQK